MNLDSIKFDMNVAEGIAKTLAPYETGNLRFNAIKSQLTDDGFRIKYSLADAFYIYFLEEGTRKSTTHQGFIANETLPTIASFISAKHKQRNKKVVNHFRYRANQSQIDESSDWEQRAIRNEYSRNLDIDLISKKQGWEHNTSMEIYDDNFESRRLY